jgi:hypothetical protein
VHKPAKSVRVYDKHKPEGEQDIAFLYASADKGTGYVLFVCKHSPEGVNYLNKQHAIEFATGMLMLALGLPGDVPVGDCTFTVPDEQEPGAAPGAPA